MPAACEHCGLPLQRESGFYLGAIYFNYGLTAVLTMIGYPLLAFAIGVPQKLALGATLAFAILFPLCFFRHARSLWLAFDQFVDPSPR
jgi:hypothetical protein